MAPAPLPRTAPMTPSELRDFCIARDVSRPEILADGEILGLADDGRLIQWDEAGQQTYVSDTTPEAFGVERLAFLEIDRLQRDGWRRPEASPSAPAPGR